MTRETRDRLLFNRIARTYAKKDSAVSSSLARKSKLLSTITPVLATFSEPITIVDIGCGVGAPAKYLTGCYARYIGIDQSEELIEAAKIFHHGNPRAEFIAANMKSPNVAHSTADVILSDGALHHMTELDNVMTSLLWIAKPGAFLVIREPHNRNPLIGLLRWIRGFVDVSYSQEQRFFSEQELQDLLARHGISEVTIRYHGFLSTPFAEVVIPPQAIMVPLSRLAIAIDRWIEKYAPRALQQLSFNIIAIGRFPKKRLLLLGDHISHQADKEN